MIKLYVPKYEDLWFRQMFMADNDTMSYNHAWGGPIPFPEQEWETWYDKWILNAEGKRFYHIAIDNSAIALFLKDGFVEDYRTSEYIMLKKELKGKV